MAFDDDKRAIASMAIGVNDMVAGGMLDDNELEASVEVKAEVNYDHVTGYIINEFNKNDRARDDSDIEDRILDSVRAYNGTYSDKDRALIALTGGSEIFMNVTATKARAAKSWIADIMLPSTGNAWAINPSPIADLHKELQDMIETALAKEFEELNIPPEAPPEQPQAQPGQPPASKMEQAQETIRDTNQRRRDIQRAMKGEITAEAEFQLERMSLKIDDQFKEGNWDEALLAFLDDF